MEDAGVDLPAGAGLETKRSREEEDAVVALVPVLEAAPDVGLGRARLEPHERVRKVIVGLVVLRREVVRLGLALAAEELRLRVALVHVMGNRPHVVEKLAEQVPALLPLHHRRAEQEIARLVDRVLQQKSAAVLEADVAQPLVGGRARAVVGVGRRREPALVDAAAVAAERIQIARVELEPFARNHERTRHPARLEPQHSATRVYRTLDLRPIQHWPVLNPRFIDPRDPRPVSP